MKSMSRDQAIIGAIVPNPNECLYFKISPPATSAAEAWQLSPLPESEKANAAAGSFLVSFAANEQLAQEQEKKISGSGSGFELKRKNDRIFLCGREILLQCPQSELDARLSMLQDFCSLYSKTEDLEKRVEQLLKTAKEDSAYTGRVDPHSLVQFSQLNEKNRASTIARIDFAGIKREILKAEEKQSDTKLFEELLEESGLSERVELLDDEIEIAEEVYSVCIDRLSEFNYFWREYKAELWIILILVVELAEFFVDLYIQLRAVH